MSATKQDNPGFVFPVVTEDALVQELIKTLLVNAYTTKKIKTLEQIKETLSALTKAQHTKLIHGINEAYEQLQEGFSLDLPQKNAIEALLRRVKQVPAPQEKALAPAQTAATSTLSADQQDLGKFVAYVMQIFAQADTVYKQLEKPLSALVTITQDMKISINSKSNLCVVNTLKKIAGLDDTNIKQEGATVILTPSPKLGEKLPPHIKAHAISLMAMYSEFSKPDAGIFKHLTPKFFNETPDTELIALSNMIGQSGLFPLSLEEQELESLYAEFSENIASIIGKSQDVGQLIRLFEEIKGVYNQIAGQNIPLWYILSQNHEETPVDDALDTETEIDRNVVLPKILDVVANEAGIISKFFETATTETATTEAAASQVDLVAQELAKMDITTKTKYENLQEYIKNICSSIVYADGRSMNIKVTEIRGGKIFIETNAHKGLSNILKKISGLDSITSEGQVIISNPKKIVDFNGFNTTDGHKAMVDALSSQLIQPDAGVLKYFDLFNVIIKDVKEDARLEKLAKTLIEDSGLFAFTYQGTELHNKLLVIMSNIQNLTQFCNLFGQVKALEIGRAVRVANEAAKQGNLQILEKIIKFLTEDLENNIEELAYIKANIPHIHTMEELLHPQDDHAEVHLEASSSDNHDTKSDEKDPMGGHHHHDDHA